jgi:DUF218 domain
MPRCDYDLNRDALEGRGTIRGNDRRALWGLLVRRNRWGLSFWAKILLGAILILGGNVAVRGIYPFLAITKPVNTDVLIVEGWVHPFVIEAGAKEFKNGTYRRIFVTGGPVVGKGGYVNDFQTSASVGADRLKAVGVPAEDLQMVPSRVSGRDRTYSSAVALRDWLRHYDQQLQSFNVMTEGAHGRRSRLMFERAFGPNVKIGVISITTPDFDARHWWQYSEGTEEVVQETIAYFYAKFLFGAIRREQEAPAGKH